MSPIFPCIHLRISIIENGNVYLHVAIIVYFLVYISLLILCSHKQIFVCSFSVSVSVSLYVCLSLSLFFLSFFPSSFIWVYSFVCVRLYLLHSISCLHALVDL